MILMEDPRLLGAHVWYCSVRRTVTQLLSQILTLRLFFDIRHIEIQFKQLQW